MRLTFTREFYTPKGATEIRAADSTAVAYLVAATSRRDGSPIVHAVAFSGKRNKPDFNYTFKTDAQAREYIAKHAADTKAGEERRAKAKAERYDVRAADHYKVGDLLRTSWGYDQTNVEFFKIVRVLDKSVEVVAIGGKQTDNWCGPVSCHVAPDPSIELEGWQAEHNGIKRVTRCGDSVHVRIHEHSNGYPIKLGQDTYCSWGH